MVQKLIRFGNHEFSSVSEYYVSVAAITLPASQGNFHKS